MRQTETKKQSFVLHTSQYEAIKCLSIEDKGLLLDAMYQYAIDQTIIGELSPMANLAFTFIKTRMDEDRKHYEEVCEKRRESGKKGGAPRGNQNAAKPETVKADEAKQPNGYKNNQNSQMVTKTIKNKQNKLSDTDTDTDTDSDTDSDTDINESKEIVATHVATSVQDRGRKFYNGLIPYVQTYGADMIRQFYDYWSEPNKSKTKMRFELEKTWDLDRRLKTWSNRQKDFGHGNLTHTEQKAVEKQQRASEVVALIARLREQDATEQY